MTILEFIFGIIIVFFLTVVAIAYFGFKYGNIENKEQNKKGSTKGTGKVK